MNKYKKLFSNSIIFAIGNLGSKVITFFMVPFYTHYLTVKQYGTTDLLLTISSLIIPIITFSVIESVFRFCLSPDSNDKAVLTNGFLISIFGFIVFIPIAIIGGFFNKYSLVIFLISYVTSVQMMLQQFSRGIGKSVIFSVTGLVVTAVTVLSNLVTIGYYSLGVTGYLLSLVIAQVIAIIYLVIALNIWKYISFNSFSIKLIKSMLLYSIPLIPNMISWWISNSSSKLLIGIFLGTTANGIFAVANKIPSLISVAYSIFTQAWQISAVDEFENKKGNTFFNQIFNFTFELLIIGVSFITILSKPLVLLLSNDSYFSAWTVVPWLALSVLYSCLSSFLGSIFTSAMKTGSLFTSTIIGAIINFIINLILIPTIGIVGAGIGSLCAFIVVTFLRLIKSRDILRIEIDYFRFVSSQVIIFIQILLLYLKENILLYSVLIILFLIILFLNIYPMAKTIINFLKLKKHEK